MNETILSAIKNLRRDLHECPELAFQETKTKEMLKAFICQRTSLELIDLGTCFCFVKKAGRAEGEAFNTPQDAPIVPNAFCEDVDISLEPIAFRADFDAVAGKDGRAGHYCGHDGHSAALAGLALVLDQAETDRDVYLLFQPAEETGQGAVLFQKLLAEKKIGEVYGFHNIPGYPAGAILLRDETFACASTGLELCFKGCPAHAAYPESGVNPGVGIRKLLQYVEERIKLPSEGMILATLIGIDAGSQAYGVSASEAKVRYTIRGERDAEFQKLLEDILNQGTQIAREEGLSFEWKGIEAFPATENDASATANLRYAAKAAGLPVLELSDPFRWSEDFGYYLRQCKGAMFGVGAGEDHPDLHTEAYEFNDEILEAVLKVYCSLLGIL